MSGLVELGFTSDADLLHDAWMSFFRLRTWEDERAIGSNEGDGVKLWRVFGTEEFMELRELVDFDAVHLIDDHARESAHEGCKLITFDTSQDDNILTLLEATLANVFVIKAANAGIVEFV